MKLEKTTSWLFFRMLYCTGTQFTFIGWLCGTELISSVALPVRKYGGGKFLGIRLCLALAQEPTQKIWVGRQMGLQIFFDIILLLKLPHCTPLNTYPVRQHTLKCCLTTQVKVRLGLRASLKLPAFRISTSDNKNNDNINNDKSIYIAYFSQYFALNQI